MKKTFVASKLEDLVKPDSLVEVLEVLIKNSLVEAYEWDMTANEITIEIPKNVEIREIMSGFEEFVENSKKRSAH